jgi:hypothetical protein
MGYTKVFLWSTSAADSPSFAMEIAAPVVSVDDLIMLAMLAAKMSHVFSVTVEVPADQGMYVYTRSAVTLWGRENLEYRVGHYVL